jgi:hypothetical protein
MSKKIAECRNCKCNFFLDLFSLGKLSFSGKFAENQNENIPKDFINLIICKKCKLVQLDRNFNPKYLYGKDYGYRSGINKTMTNHLHQTAIKIEKLARLRSGDCVIDIASNDGTLLNGYKKNLVLVGIDPIINKFSQYYKKKIYLVNNFFNAKSILKLNLKKKIKAITALSVFYDLKDPNKFLKDISVLIDKKNGIFLLEHADLYSIIKYNLFDTLCHEHLEYYSTKIILEMAKKNNLKIIDIERNNINGGSTRFYMCHKQSNYIVKENKIKNFLIQEKRLNLENVETYKVFFLKIKKIRIKLKNILHKIHNKKKTIHGYGASTKGNILLQFYGINNKLIKYISDRNLEKNGKFTPGSKIKIITEEKSRSLTPDHYLVLPWHFRKEILLRERKLLKKKTYFIFPLPKVEITK